MFIVFGLNKMKDGLDDSIIACKVKASFSTILEKSDTF